MSPLQRSSRYFYSPSRLDKLYCWKTFLNTRVISIYTYIYKSHFLLLVINVMLCFQLSLLIMWWKPTQIYKWMTKIKMILPTISKHWYLMENIKYNNQHKVLISLISFSFLNIFFKKCFLKSCWNPWYQNVISIM